MKRATIWSALVGAALAGCGAEEEPAAPTGTTPASAAEVTARGVALTAEEIEQIDKLPEPDRAEAVAQKLCPVGEGHLGTPGMGVPVKKVVDGKAVFLCCEGCEAEFDGDPQKYLARAERFKRGE